MAKKPIQQPTSRKHLTVRLPIRREECQKTVELFNPLYAYIISIWDNKAAGTSVALYGG